MPSPIGHVLGGVIVALALGARRKESGLRPQAPGPTSHAPRLMPWSIVAALAPDVDFLWGRHNMETHSLGAAVLAGVAVLALTRGDGSWRRRAAAGAMLAWSSHVLLDWLGSDVAPPLGVMALWPLTSQFYFAHAYVFEAVRREYWLPGFWTHNLGALVREVLLLTPLALVVAGWGKRA